MAEESQVLAAAFLISTPCLFREAFESDRLAISAQVASNVGDQRHLGEPGPFEHHFYVLQLPVMRISDVIFSFAVDASEVVGLLAVIYGKRVQLHGAIWLPGSGWSLPDLLNLIPNDYHQLSPYGGNHDGDSPSAYTWETLSRYPAFEAWCLDPRPIALKPLVTAAQCYAEALRLFPIDKEIAYFRLIQALESAATSVTFTDEEKFSHDSDLSQHLAWLNSLEHENGARVAKFMKDRLYQLKRSVWLWVNRNLSADFFIAKDGALTAGTLQRAVSAAYDIRSAYIHGGKKFGVWIEPALGRCGLSETIPPDFSELCDDPQLAKALQFAPSFLGLECLVRHCILNALLS